MNEVLRSLPTKRDRSRVEDTLKTVVEQEFDEVVVLGLKDGKTYLNHSKLTDTFWVVGALESIKHRLLEK